MPNLPLLFSLSWIARVVFLARTLLCVRAEKEKRKFFDFSRFLRGKGMQKQKNTRAFGQRKKKRKFFDFSRFSRGKGMQKKKVQHMRSGRERKKENFSIFLFFPALSAKGVHRTKTTLLIQHSIYIY